MDPTLKVENENDDNDDSSDEEEGKTGGGAATGETPLGQKRKREKSSTSWVTMKTVFRWKQTGSVNVEHLLGCCDGSTAVELSKAQEILDTSGQLVCVLCNIPISANKKCVKRYKCKLISLGHLTSRITKRILSSCTFSTTMAADTRPRTGSI